MSDGQRNADNFTDSATRVAVPARRPVVITGNAEGASCTNTTMQARVVIKSLFAWTPAEAVEAEVCNEEGFYEPSTTQDSTCWVKTMFVEIVERSVVNLMQSVRLANMCGLGM